MPGESGSPTHRQSRKRSRSSSSYPELREGKAFFRSFGGSNQPPSSHCANNGDFLERKAEGNFGKEQTRLNQIQEAEQMREWVSKEDEFVLKQSRKKAQIRVREGRGKLIDWLAVTLSAIDPIFDPLEDEYDESEINVVDPASVFEGLNQTQLQDLGKDISTFLILESKLSNQKYWNALNVICKDYQSKMGPTQTEDRSNEPVSADIDHLLNSKSLRELNLLETKISAKIRSNEPIDVEYWEKLLSSIAVYKAKAELYEVYEAIINSRLKKLKQQQASDAAIVREKLAVLVYKTDNVLQDTEDHSPIYGKPPDFSNSKITYCRLLDPEPRLKLRSEHKTHDIIEEAEFMEKIALERKKVSKTGYIPLRQTQSDKKSQSRNATAADVPLLNPTGIPSIVNEDFSQATTALYEREVARGVQENEEIFAGEEEVSSSSKPKWANKYRPRKPRYFNRIQMGYEWNKYNQTHYDHDNPPPKVVQGYKFNIFYPDLIDKAKAPTYRIERENGRKRGQSFAPAGEEDTCLIRFVSGPPYEDLAFRIVDKEWDYSAKRERGFRSSFDKGILQLHFQFKKVYYRK